MTPSRDGITSMNLAAGKLRSDIQFVCICIVLWCFWRTCEICNSFLKPVCCLERAEFQLQLQISLKGKAFKPSDRAARCQLPLSHNQMGGTVASSHPVFLISVCSYSLWSLGFFVFFVVDDVFLVRPTYMNETKTQQWWTNKITFASVWPIYM